jgi:radical SAM superfamily enzyme with C-terminal helix-hairpin-helix motif
MLHVIGHRVLPLALPLIIGCSVVDRIERAIPRPPPHGIDLNTATREELAQLPGLSDADAERLVRNRPYASREEVLQRAGVSKDLYDKFADRVYVSRPGPSRAASPSGPVSKPPT